MKAKEKNAREFAEKYRGCEIIVGEMKGIVVGHDNKYLAMMGNDYNNYAIEALVEDMDGELVIFSEYKGIAGGVFGWQEYEELLNEEVEVRTERTNPIEITSVEDEEDLVEDYKRRFSQIKTIYLSKQCTVVVLDTADAGIVKVQRNEKEDVRIGILEAYIKALHTKDIRIAFIQLKGDVADIKLTDKYCTITLFDNTSGKFIFSKDCSLGAEEKMLEAYKIARVNKKALEDNVYQLGNQLYRNHTIQLTSNMPTFGHVHTTL